MDDRGPGDQPLCRPPVPVHWRQPQTSGQSPPSYRVTLASASRNGNLGRRIDEGTVPLQRRAGRRQITCRVGPWARPPSASIAAAADDGAAPGVAGLVRLPPGARPEAPGQRPLLSIHDRALEPSGPALVCAVPLVARPDLGLLPRLGGADPALGPSGSLAMPRSEDRWRPACRPLSDGAASARHLPPAQMRGTGRDRFGWREEKSRSPLMSRAKVSCGQRFGGVQRLSTGTRGVSWTRPASGTSWRPRTPGWLPA
jgi:hypothetical protein